MREIKFRGKRPCSSEWVYGYLINWSGRRPSIIVQRGDADQETGEVYYDDFIVDPETIGQYTGLRDIYEGDIVENKHVRGVVKFGNPDFKEGSQTSMFYVEVIELLDYEIFTFEDDIWTEFNSLKKIGNIFDNPNLLEVAE